MIKQKSHKISFQKTSTGKNFRVTISQRAAKVFSGCVLYETILSDGILLCVSGGVVEKSPTFNSQLEQTRHQIGEKYETKKNTYVER